MYIEQEWQRSGDIVDEMEIRVCSLLLLSTNYCYYYYKIIIINSKVNKTLFIS